MTTVLIILTLTVVLFIWGKWPPDVVALLSMLLLYLTGILDLAEVLAGFSNPTVIMIAGLFLIGEGLSRTGWTARAGRRFVQWAGRSAQKLQSLVSLGSGVLSGFVSNTGTVAALLPVSVTAAWAAGSMPSKVLMPMAFGSNTGGLLTLTGTPPNIIVSNTLVQEGFEGFSFFEFSLIGLPLLLVLLLYFRFGAYRLLPSTKKGNKPASIDTEIGKWIQDYSIGEGLYRLRIRSMSPLIGSRLGDWDFEKNHQVAVVRLKRRHPKRIQGIPPFVEMPDPQTSLRYHDILTVKGDAEDVNRLVLTYSLAILPFSLESESDLLKQELINHEVGLAEMLISPKSVLIGRTVPLGHRLEQFGIQLIAGSRDNQALHGNIRIKAGDAFVIRGSWSSIEALNDFYEQVVISGSPEALEKDVDQLDGRSFIALGTLLLMIALLVLNVLPGSITALICAGIMLLTGCVPISKAYKSVGWSSVIMIAAMIPMGSALAKTGAAQWAAESLVYSLGNWHPLALLGGLFLLTSLLSQTINNSATTVLMAPIALMAAVGMDLSPKPFLMAVAVSASTAFLTPVGTTTNAMVLSAGGYRFTDYLKVGSPLLLLYLLISLTLIPMIWSF